MSYRGTIYYAVSNADGFPALMALAPGGAPQRMAWRTLGTRTSVRGGCGSCSTRSSGCDRSRSIPISTRCAPTADPVAGSRATRAPRIRICRPTGGASCCTVQAVGRRAMALVAFPPSGLATPRLLIDDPDADYTGPRWSPDGRRIVAARRRAGVYELVLIDPATREVRPLAARTTRAWSRRPGRRTARRCSLPRTSRIAVQRLRRGRDQPRDHEDHRHGRRRAVSRTVAERDADLRRLHAGRDTICSLSLSIAFRLKAETTGGRGQAETTGGGWRAEAAAKDTNVARRGSEHGGKGHEGSGTSETGRRSETRRRQRREVSARRRRSSRPTGRPSSRATPARR